MPQGRRPLLVSVSWFLDFTEFVSETELTGDGTVSVPLIYPIA